MKWVEFSEQWRTGIILIVLALVILASFLFAIHNGTDVGERMFSTCAWSLVALGGFAAGKATLEHAANGSGLKGAVAAIMTEVKPGEMREEHR